MSPQMSKKCRLKPQTLKGGERPVKMLGHFGTWGTRESSVAVLTLFEDDTLAAGCQLACLPS